MARLFSQAPRPSSHAQRALESSARSVNRMFPARSVSNMFTAPHPSCEDRTATGCPPMGLPSASARKSRLGHAGLQPAARRASCSATRIESQATRNPSNQNAPCQNSHCWEARITTTEPRKPSLWVWDLVCPVGFNCVGAATASSSHS